MAQIVLSVPDHLGDSCIQSINTVMQNMLGCALSCVYSNNAQALEHIITSCTNIVEENMKKYPNQKKDDVESML